MGSSQAQGLKEGMDKQGRQSGISRWKFHKLGAKRAWASRSVPLEGTISIISPPPGHISDEITEPQRTIGVSQLSHGAAAAQPKDLGRDSPTSQFQKQS